MCLCKKYIAILFILFFTKASKAQITEPNTNLNNNLEAVTIISKPIDEFFFIDLILNDKSLYESFINMKHFSFIAENDILTFDKENISAHIYKKIAHCNYGKNYKQLVIDSIDSGKVYKRNGKYRLFTVQMFSYLFENISSTDFTDHIVNHHKNIFNKELYKGKLKTLIFNPGKTITELPFISSKSEIFSDKLKRYYQSKISTIHYNGQPAYLFEYYVAPNYASENSLIIQKLNTIIDKYNLKILSRFIHLKYNNLLFSFDINMNIKTGIIEDMSVPIKIQYDGSWHMLFKKTEKVKFNVHHYNYISNDETKSVEFCNNNIKNK